MKSWTLPASAAPPLCQALLEMSLGGATTSTMFSLGMLVLAGKNHEMVQALLSISLSVLQS